MKLSNLTFIVTDDCNFNCTYCMQKKEKKTITDAIIGETVDFFFPFFNPVQIADIGFYGGEPLLAFDRIRFAVQQLEERNRFGECPGFQYTVTTNGSLIDEEMLDFFDRLRFRVILSFDGIAQEVSRQKCSPQYMIAAIKNIQRFPRIILEVNSVFQPNTVHMMLDSLGYIIERTIPQTPDITFTFDTLQDWDPGQIEEADSQVRQLRRYIDIHYNRFKCNPLTNTRSDSRQLDEPNAPFRCSAGTAQMAVTPTGDLWGCFLFHDFFKNRPGHPDHKNYAYGNLSEFVENFTQSYPKITANYRDLRQDFYRVQDHDHCFLCPEVHKCMVCPLNAAYSTNRIGLISPQTCILEKTKHIALTSNYGESP